MDTVRSKLSANALILSMIAWSYPIFAEFMTPVMSMIAAPAAYLSCLTSFVMAVIASVKRTDQNLPLASTALFLNTLFIAFAVYSALVMPWPH